MLLGPSPDMSITRRMPSMSLSNSSALAKRALEMEVRRIRPMEASPSIAANTSASSKSSMIIHGTTMRCSPSPAHST